MLSKPYIWNNVRASLPTAYIGECILLANIHDHIVMPGWFIDDKFYCIVPYNRECHSEEISHWMPLPEPPE